MLYSMEKSEEFLVIEGHNKFCYVGCTDSSAYIDVPLVHVLEHELDDPIISLHLDSETRTIAKHCYHSQIQSHLKHQSMQCPPAMYVKAERGKKRKGHTIQMIQREATKT